MRLFTLLAMLAATPPVPAQPPVVAPAPDATEVSGVTVVARRATPMSEVEVVAGWCPKADPARYGGRGAPRVVSSYPAPGAVVAPGVLTLSVTFDQSMTCSWAVDYASKGPEPCRPEGVWMMPDRTTWQVRCDLRARSDYRVRFGDIDGVSFVGRSGLPAPDYELRFSTSDDRTIESEAERAARDPDAPKPATAGYVVCGDNSSGDPRTCTHQRATPEEVAAQ